MKSINWLKRFGVAEVALILTLATLAGVLITAVAAGSYAEFLAHVIGAALGFIAMTLIHWGHADHLAGEVSYPSSFQYLLGGVVGWWTVSLLHLCL